MICKSSRLATGCAHAAKLLEYWENRQILENLEPSNTFKAKAIFETKKRTKYLNLVSVTLFVNPSLVLSRRSKQKQAFPHCLRVAHY